MAGHERVIRHALFEHVDQRVSPPVRRIAYRGEVAHLDDADLARGERFGAFLAPGERLVVPLPAGATAVVPLAADGVDLDPVGVVPALEVVATAPQAAPAGPLPTGRPPQVAPKQAWVDYAVSTGLTSADAEAKTKAELIELLGS